MSPTPSSVPVAGITCVTPIDPTWLFVLWSSRDSAQRKALAAACRELGRE